MIPSKHFAEWHCSIDHPLSRTGYSLQGPVQNKNTAPFKCVSFVLTWKHSTRSCPLLKDIAQESSFYLAACKSLLLYLIIFTNMKIWYSNSQLKTKQQQKMSLINHSSHLPISVFPFPAETSQIWYPYLPGESHHHFLSILSWPHYNQNFNNTNPLIWLFLWSQCSFHCQINSSSYSVHQ